MDCLELVAKHYGKEPTQKQKDVISKIDAALRQGYQKILLSAPTGTGKSWIAVALSLYFRSATILTSTVLLQDQYKEEFSFVKTVRGKKRFLCEQSNRVLDCTQGYCKNCQFRPSPDDYTVARRGTISETIVSQPMERRCEYYDQIEAGKQASFVAYSYASYLSHLLSGEEMPRRELLVCDESHELDEELSKQLATNLSSFMANLAGPSMPQFSVDSEISRIKRYVDSFLDFYGLKESSLKKCAEHTVELQSEEHIRKHYTCSKHSIIQLDCMDCQKMRSFIENKEFLACSRHIDCSHDHRKINHYLLNDLQNYASRLKILQKGLEVSDENYIITDAKDGNVTIKPWKVHWFVRELMSSFKVSLFMSATTNLELFCRETGIDREEVFFIDEDSNIPIQNRKVVFLKSGYVDGSSDEPLPKGILKQIEAILRLRSNQKGIIVLTSYSQMEYILENISQGVRSRLVPIERNQDKFEIIREHRDMENSVLISPGLESGVNLPDEDSRFQIIVKAPYYPTVDDKRMKKIYESESNHRRYYLKSAFRLLQMAGRSIRHVDDHAMTYVLDSKAERMVHYQRNDLPKWFLDACDGVN